MTFEDDFPGLKDEIIGKQKRQLVNPEKAKIAKEGKIEISNPNPKYIYHDERTVLVSAVQKHCLDKQKVINEINKIKKNTPLNHKDYEHDRGMNNALYYLEKVLGLK